MPAPFFVRHGCIAGILCLMYGQAPGGLSVIRRECEGRPFLRGAGGEAAAPYFPGRELKRGFFAGVRGEGYAAPEGCEGATTGAFAARLPAKKRRRLPGQLKIWEILTACKAGASVAAAEAPAFRFSGLFRSLFSRCQACGRCIRGLADAESSRPLAFGGTAKSAVPSARRGRRSRETSDSYFFTGRLAAGASNAEPAGKPFR